MWLNRAGLFKDLLPQSLKCFGTNLMDLAKVVKSSFGNDVQEGWRGNIQDFQKSYKELKMTWTPSLHGIVSHVEDWYDLMGTERGLGWYSEQATEHAHTAWADVWINRRYKRDFSHPDYGSQLKAGMATFNSEHE